MFIDSHCHLDRLDLTPYEGDFSRFVDHTHRQQIDRMLCVSINLEDYGSMLEQVKTYENIAVSVGVHPNERDCQEPTADELIALAANPKVVAIGETGLDYFRSNGDVSWQQNRFRTHIAAAKASRKPLIIHTREAKSDTLRILEEEGADTVGGVFHCFTEDWETAQKALDLNFYVSFSGIVTFRNAAQIQVVARKVPEDRFLIETDSPYLAPIPHRGKPNYPEYVRHVADFVAKLRGDTSQKVGATSTRNYYRLFGPAE